jgi:prefoldin beta subunit
MENPESKIQELTFIEQNLQNLLFEKQALNLELSEVESALTQLNNSKDEVFKLLGNLLVRHDKSKMLEELNEKKKILELRLSSLEKQEELFSKKLVELRKEILG